MFLRDEIQQVANSRKALAGPAYLDRTWFENVSNGQATGAHIKTTATSAWIHHRASSGLRNALIVLSESEW